MTAHEDFGCSNGEDKDDVEDSRVKIAHSIDGREDEEQLNIQTNPFLKSNLT